MVAAKMAPEKTTVNQVRRDRNPIQPDCQRIPMTAIEPVSLSVYHHSPLSK